MRRRFALNGLNFFNAGVQAGFGPFVAVWLTKQGWSQTALGLTLSVGSLAGLIGQLPGGILVDQLHSKRFVAAGAVLVTGLASIILGLYPSFQVVSGALMGNALANCVLIPAIAALTLSLCGHDGFGERLGHNTRYAALGNAASAVLLGAAASYISVRSVFLVTAALTVPAIFMLLLIRGSDRVEDDHPALKHPKEREHWPWQIFAEPALYVFTVAVALFQLGNAALLPMALNDLTRRHEASGFLVSATIIVPQVIAAALAPRAGKLAQAVGRRPVLIVGFAAVSVRGLLFAMLPGPVPLALIQALDGISAAVAGLMLPLIAADLTRRTGYMNLAIGWFGLASGAGATLGTVMAGSIADHFGDRVMFLCLAGASAAAVLLLWIAMPETRPAQRGASKGPQRRGAEKASQPA
jgi:predicted MFS family arabinose efflux permease